MPYFHLRLSVAHLPPNHVANTLLRPFLCVPEFTHCQPKTFKWNIQESFPKKISPSLAIVNSWRLHPIGALQTSVDVGEMSSFCNFHQSRVSINLFDKQPMNEDAEIDRCSDSCGSLSDEYHKEEQRRRKIGLANKGRVPWNKGRKHTKETRMRIKQRTIEALRDPKVRKKMCEHPRIHSDHSKEKIRSSLRRVWDKRLKWRQLKEKFLLLWSENIAETAKKGGSDQQELDWDSYDKIKQEITLQQLQWAADKAKAKEIAKIRAEKAAFAKAEKIAKLAQKRKEREETEKASREMKRTLKKLEKDKQKIAVAQELNLKRRLTKIHKKKSIQGRVATGGDTMVSVIPYWEKLDVELIKKEKMRRKVSLADQIQAAKNRRADSIVVEVLASSSAIHQSSVRLGE